MTAIYLELFKAAVWVVSFFLNRAEENKENTREYQDFLKIMNQKGLSTVAMRLKAEEQREDIKEQWEEEERAKKS